MRIDQAKAMTVFGILHREMFDQSGLARPGLAQHEQVMLAVTKLDAKRAFAAAVVGEAHGGDGLDVCVR